METIFERLGRKIARLKEQKVRGEFTRTRRPLGMLEQANGNLRFLPDMALLGPRKAPEPVVEIPPANPVGIHDWQVGDWFVYDLKVINSLHGYLRGELQVTAVYNDRESVHFIDGLGNRTWEYMKYLKFLRRWAEEVSRPPCHALPFTFKNLQLGDRLRVKGSNSVYVVQNVDGPMNIILTKVLKPDGTLGPMMYSNHLEIFEGWA